MFNKISNRISEILKADGMTQNELARRSGLQDGQLNKIIRGVHTPRIDTVFKICRALKKPVEKVFFCESSKAA